MGLSTSNISRTATSTYADARHLCGEVRHVASVSQGCSASPFVLRFALETSKVNLLIVLHRASHVCLFTRPASIGGQQLRFGTSEKVFDPRPIVRVKVLVSGESGSLDMQHRCRILRRCFFSQRKRHSSSILALTSPSFQSSVSLPGGRSDTIR